MVHSNECGEHSVPPRSPFHSPSCDPHAPNAMSPPASEKKMRHLVLDSLVFAGSTQNMLASRLLVLGSSSFASCESPRSPSLLSNEVLFVLDSFDPRLTSSHGPGDSAQITQMTKESDLENKACVAPRICKQMKTTSTSCNL